MCARSAEQSKALNAYSYLCEYLIRKEDDRRSFNLERILATSSASNWSKCRWWRSKNKGKRYQPINLNKILHRCTTLVYLVGIFCRWCQSKSLHNHVAKGEIHQHSGSSFEDDKKELYVYKIFTASALIKSNQIRNQQIHEIQKDWRTHFSSFCFSSRDTINHNDTFRRFR